MKAYYNEIDPYAAQWLRNLIAAGLIAPGDVDERSIVEVKPDDLSGYTQCHFFAGIGIWSHALRSAGWSDSQPVWTGSCPCQPFSTAGKGDGAADPRHLWPTWFKLIDECRPVVCFGEQVASPDGLAWLDLGHADLEEAGYAIGALDLCAAGAGAPHIRQRLCFVADAQNTDWRPGVGRTEKGTGAIEERWRRLAGSGAIGGMADSAWTSSTRQREHGRSTPLRAKSEILFNRGSGTVANSDRQEQGTVARQPHAGPDGRRHVGRSGRADGVANATSARLEEWGIKPEKYGAQQQASERTGGGLWSDAIWIECRDGRLRAAPPEPEFQPLAYGASARMGRLRAYGNAIVAPLAAEFIAAYMECRP